MKHTVYYIDDQSHPQTVEANTARMAAWKFLALHPRTDTSQITVESHPSVPWQSSGMTHFRACDLLSALVPPDEAEPELAIRLTVGPEPSYVVSGSSDSLRLLGNRLIRFLDEFPTQANPLRIKPTCGFSVVTGSSRFPYGFSFQVDADVAQYWANQLGTRGFWRYGFCLARIVFAIFAFIGIWTVVTWLFRS